MFQLISSLAHSMCIHSSHSSFTCIDTPSPIHHSLYVSSCLNLPFQQILRLGLAKYHVCNLDWILKIVVRVLVSSGQSQKTCIPPALHYIPPRSAHEDVINEAQMRVLFHSICYRQSLSTGTLCRDVLRQHSQNYSCFIILSYIKEARQNYGFIQCYVLF
ncbi:unnamed protein product [Lactuca virosa]|uniref:Uncharacterized protein n=1 Tax=Lactuca virosa TaxID=75947 RepID=A0AAU9PNY2_9ASTR|nr:unnamed protein product [Lactuca virosa]